MTGAVERSHGRAVDAQPSGESLLFAGGLFCDLTFADAGIPTTGEEVFARSLRMSPGGVATRAVAAARLGAHASIVSIVGDDPLGRFVRDALSAENRVDVSEIAVLPHHQTAVTVALTDKNDRSFITYEEQASTPEPREQGFAAAHVSVAEELPEWTRTMRQTGTLLFGGVGWDASEGWSSEVLDNLELVDVFVPNEVEAIGYTGVNDAVTAAKVLAEHVSLAVVTRGANGVVAVDSTTNTVYDIPGISVDAIDPTGAGDVFVGALMAGSLHGWDTETNLRFACLCAATSVTQIGSSAAAPTVQHLHHLIDDGNVPGEWSFLSDLPRSSKKQSYTESHQKETS